jgi:hypothetical protein
MVINNQKHLSKSFDRSEVTQMKTLILKVLNHFLDSVSN